MNGAGGLAGWRWVRRSIPNCLYMLLTQALICSCSSLKAFLLYSAVFTRSSSSRTVSLHRNFAHNSANARHLDPETVKFLSEAEREAVLAELPEQAPTMKAKTVNVQQIKDLFGSSTFVPFLMIWITHGIGGWGISFVLPTVIYELGISNTAISQVMTMVWPLKLTRDERRLTVYSLRSHLYL